jgi:hypothetical protein
MSAPTGTVASVPKPRVYVCGERGCGTRSERRLLVAALEREAQVVRVSCQSVCDGPVAGTVVAGELQWFERVAKPKARAGLAQLVRSADGELPKALAKRRKRKRSGKLRG